MTFSITPPAGNIFEDLGFPQEEAANLKIRADLMLNLREHLECQSWTLADAAERLGEPLGAMQHLMDGDIDEFNVDQLILMLFKAGLGVRFEIVPLLA